MTPVLLTGLLALVSYFTGSIPFGLLIGKWVFGIDLRTRGSGNIGATNAGRTLGKGWGLTCLLLDFLKGLLPTLLLPRLTAVPAEWFTAVSVACGTAAILGHIFPVWLGFRGGKGVATGAGVALTLSWIAGTAALAAFAITLASKRIVSLSSMIAAVVYAITVVAMTRDLSDQSRWPLLAFALAIPALIIFRHRDNMTRLWRGEEPPLGGKSSDSPDAEPSRHETHPSH